MVGGRLRPEAQPALANYLVRFADAFAAEGVPIFALTLQNEPGFEPGNYPGMKLDPKERASIIGSYLGPALSKREQLGSQGHYFKMLNFRTENHAPQGWNEPPQLTRIGAFLYWTRIDALPQLFNVLRGDLTIAGTEGRRPYFAD